MNLQRFFGSMAGRLFAFLLIGVVGSASLALVLADVRRYSDLERINLERVADRTQDFVSLLNGAPTGLRDRMLSEGILGLRPPLGTEKLLEKDDKLTKLLSSRLGSSSLAQSAQPSTCIQPAVKSFYAQLNCWVISVPLADRSKLTLVTLTPRTDTFDLPRPDTVFLSILTLAVGILAFFAARMVAAPLGDLSRAARALGGDLDRSPLSERGPYEVRDAIRAFNAMQAKLREHMVERTRILASITHDLQTPLTRLRLRLEKVEDIALRSRLIDDFAGMQILIRQGLDFCRGTQIEEPFVPVALDSLLESVVEDAAEGGRPVTLEHLCGYYAEARPNSLQRCLANLIDNALAHGGSAHVSAAMENGKIRVRVRDFGPGIPPEKLESVFEPFVRLETSQTRPGGGVGLGLTIARAMAEQNEAGLMLCNHPGGGLEACLVLSRGLQRAEPVGEVSRSLESEMDLLA
jgi:signal transduction histidine kinase